MARRKRSYSANSDNLFGTFINNRVADYQKGVKEAEREEQARLREIKKEEKLRASTLEAQRKAQKKAEKEQEKIQKERLKAQEKAEKEAKKKRDQQLKEEKKREEERLKAQKKYVTFSERTKVLLEKHTLPIESLEEIIEVAIKSETPIGKIESDIILPSKSFWACAKVFHEISDEVYFDDLQQIRQKAKKEVIEPSQIRSLAFFIEAKDQKDYDEEQKKLEEKLSLRKKEVETQLSEIRTEKDWPDADFSELEDYVLANFEDIKSVRSLSLFSSISEKVSKNIAISSQLEGIRASKLLFPLDLQVLEDHVEEHFDEITEIKDLPLYIDACKRKKDKIETLDSRGAKFGLSLQSIDENSAVKTAIPSAVPVKVVKWTSILLGIFGFHRFLLGRVFTGLLMLVTSSIFIYSFLNSSIFSEANYAKGVVETNVNVRSSPDLEASIVETASPKDHFYVSETSNEKWLVFHPNLEAEEGTGYVWKELVTISDELVASEQRVDSWFTDSRESITFFVFVFLIWLADLIRIKFGLLNPKTGVAY